MIIIPNDLMLKIRRRETPCYDRLYRIAKAIRRFEVPPIRPVFQVLAWERSLRRTSWHTFTRVFYHTPIFKLRCRQFGKNLYMAGGMPLVMGNLQLHVGDDVVMHGVSTLIGAKVFDEPTLFVGNNTHLGYQLIVNVGADVRIGNDVLIGDRVSILSYDGHPTNPSERHLPATKASSKPIVIGNNVWIGANCTILKGVSIGEGSVIGTGTIVTSKLQIPVNSMVYGNPAQCVPLVRS